MSTRKSILAVCLGLAAAFVLNAQTTAPTPSQTPATTPTAAIAAPANVPDGGMPRWIKPETAEHRTARLGTDDDPGIDPKGVVEQNGAVGPGTKHYWRFGHSYHIEKTELRWANFEGADEGWAR